MVDNHRAHGTPLVREFCQSKGLELKFLPPYSSALNPIERFWALVKGRWKKDISRCRIKYDHTKMREDVEALMRLVAASLTEDILRCIDPYIAKVGLG